MIRLTLAVLCAVAVAATGLASTGAAAGSKIRIVKREIKTGKRAYAGVGVTIKRPKTIILEALARPRQRVTMTWWIKCATLSGEREKRGRVVVTAPRVKRELAPPLRNAAACTVSASARLSGTGRVQLNVMQRL